VKWGGTESNEAQEKKVLGSFSRRKAMIAERHETKVIVFKTMGSEWKQKEFWTSLRSMHGGRDRGPLAVAWGGWRDV